MQLIPRYLVNNRTDIVVDMAGFTTEFRPVYTRQLKVTRGIDNALEFRVLNADQKPIDLANYTAKFIAFDENKNVVITHDGVNSATKGVTTITITENDLLNLKQQFLSYNIYLVDNTTDDKVLTYNDAYFGNGATMFIDGLTFPGPKTSKEATFTGLETNIVDADPGVNGNEALHTAAVYANGYVGDITVQATLDDQSAGNISWADVTTLTFTGTETEPTPINFNGVYSYVKFVASVDPAGTISKILVRN